MKRTSILPFLKIAALGSLLFTLLFIGIYKIQKTSHSSIKEPVQIPLKNGSASLNQAGNQNGSKGSSTLNPSKGNSKLQASHKTPPAPSSPSKNKPKKWDPLHPDYGFENANVVAKTETKPDRYGHFDRVSIIETDAKYPLIRVEEKVDRDPATGNEYIRHRVEMAAEHLLVKLGYHVDVSELHAAQKNLGFTSVGGTLDPNLFLLFFKGRTPDALPNAIKRIKDSNGKFVIVEPDYVMHPTDVPNDPYFSKDYGLNNTGQTGGVADADIDAPEAWSITKGSKSVLVGVIDSGVDYTHPDLAANIWTNPGEIPGNGIDDDGNGFIDDVHGWNFVSNTNDPIDDNLHGTHVAGTIGAVGNNSTGVAGVCWNVSIVPIKFLSASGSGFTSDAVNAVYYATKIGVKLTSNSWGGGGFSAALKAAIDDAAVHGILFVAAAGNNATSNDTTPHYPSSYQCANIISVAASDASDNLAYFSNFGQSVHVAAPGVSIFSTFPSYMTQKMQDNGFSTYYGTISGTSMATPHVSGLAALILSQNSSLGYADVKSKILDRGDSLASLLGKVKTGSRINAYNSVNPNYQAPVGKLNYTGVNIDDPNGNKDHVVNPGEVIQITPSFINSGKAALNNVSVEIYSDVSDCTFTGGNVMGVFQLDPNATFAPVFTAQINPNVRNNEQVDVSFVTHDSTGASQTYHASFLITVPAPEQEVSVNFQPGEMLADPIRNNVYLLDKTNKRILSIDTTTGLTAAMAALAVVNPLPPDTDDYLATGMMATSPNGKKLYVALNSSKKIQVFSLPALTPLTTFNLDFQPVGIAAGADGNLYVSTWDYWNGIKKLNGSTGAFISEFGFYYSGSLLRTNSARTRLFVGPLGLSGFTSIDEYDISVADPTLVTAHELEVENLQEFAVDEKNRRFYAAQGGFYGLQIIDMDSGATELWDFGTPYGTAVSFNPNLPTVYAASGYDIYQFDRATGGKLQDLQVTSGSQYLDGRCLAMTPNGNVIYIKQEWTGQSGQGVNGTLYWIGILGGPGLVIAPPNVPPDVSLTSPTDGAVFTGPSSINLTANASDVDGKVTKVRFYRGSTLIGTDTNAPYACVWTNIAAGSYTLTAKAYDNYGSVSTSKPVSIKVYPQPKPLRNIKIDLGSSSLTTSGGWNNLTSGAAGATITNLVDSNGLPTPANLTVVDSFWQFVPGFANKNGTTNSVLYPPTATHDSFLIGALNGQTDTVAQVHIGNLTNATYTARLYASRMVSDKYDRTTVYTINGVSKELQVKNNVDNFVEFNNIIPVNKGIDIQVSLKAGAQWAYLGVIDLYENLNPIVYAGPDQVIRTPGNSTTLNGSKSKDPELTQLTYIWSQVSGPSQATLASPTLAKTDVTGLVEGVYRFRLTAMDTQGGISSDEVQVQVTSMPIGWLGKDMGTVATPGQDYFSYYTSVYSVEGSGNGIGNTHDSGHLVWQKVSGDFEFVAWIAGMGGPDPLCQGAMMVRENLLSYARSVSIGLTRSSGTLFSKRVTTGSNAPVRYISGPTAPYWYKLLRQKDHIYAYHSSDGKNWVLVEDVTMALPNDVYIALFSSSHANNLSQTLFYNVSVTFPDDWTTFGNGPSRTGYLSGTLGTNSFNQVWSVTGPTGGWWGHLGQPIICRNKVYFTSGDSVQALNVDTGAQLWQKKFNDVVTLNPPTYADGALYLQHLDQNEVGHLWKLNAQTGEAMWSVDYITQWYNYRAPLVAEDKVFIPEGYGSGIGGYRTMTGEKLFYHDLPQYDDWTPAYRNGTVYSFVGGQLRTYDPTGGYPSWGYDLPFEAFGMSVQTVPAIDDENVYLISAGSLWVININTHNLVWSGGTDLTGSPTVANGIVYAITPNGVSAYNGKTGQLIRSYSAPEAFWQPIVTDDLVIVASRTDTYVFNKSTGQLLQHIPFGGYLSYGADTLLIADPLSFEIRAYR